jgi:hypothetical protein
VRDRYPRTAVVPPPFAGAGLRGGRTSRSFTPLSASATLVAAGAGALGLGLATGAGIHWAVQGLLWLVAGAAAGISLSGSA